MNRSRVWWLSLLLHGYLALRLLPPLTYWPAACAGLAIWLLVSAVSIPLGFSFRRAPHGTPAAWLSLVGLVAMGAFSSLFTLTVLRDLVLLIALGAHAFDPGLFDLDRLTLASAAAVPLLALVATLIGVYLARRLAPIVSVEVPIAGLPASLAGFRIAQITDLHVGPTIRAPFVRRVVDAVNGLQADMVAVTGDLVDGRVSDLSPQVAPLADLRSRHGTFFVTGNHEYYSGAHAWIAELRRIGFSVLMNQHVVLDHDGGQLVVAGVTDVGAHHFDPSHRSDPAQAMLGAPAGAGVRLLLAHQPRSAAAAERAGFDLQLSGHTHGGQFLPWNLFVRLQQPFTSGLHRLRGLWIYINRGTGYWGPPNRFGVPSEITLMRLVPALD